MGGNQLKLILPYSKKSVLDGYSYCCHETDGFKAKYILPDDPEIWAERENLSITNRVWRSSSDLLLLHILQIDIPSFL